MSSVQTHGSEHKPDSWANVRFTATQGSAQEFELAETGIQRKTAITLFIFAV